MNREGGGGVYDGYTSEEHFVIREECSWRIYCIFKKNDVYVGYSIMLQKMWWRGLFSEFSTTRFSRKGLEHKTRDWRHFSARNEHKTLCLFQDRSFFGEAGPGRPIPPSIFSKSIELEIGVTFRHKTSTELCTHSGVKFDLRELLRELIPEVAPPFCRKGLVLKTTRNWRQFSAQNNHETLRPFCGQNSILEGADPVGSNPPPIFSKRIGAQNSKLRALFSTKRAQTLRPF